jgi:hypothetical protein
MQYEVNRIFGSQLAGEAMYWVLLLQVDASAAEPLLHHPAI